MKHIASFIIHIGGSFIIYIIKADYWFIIQNIGSCTKNIFASGFLTKIILNIKVFCIVSKALVNPHVGNILISDAVCEPFMGRFMYDNKIEFQSPSATAKISSTIAIFKTIAISNRALVFHPQVRGFDKLVSILIKRILTKPVLKSCKHQRGLLKLKFRFVQVLLKYVIITIKPSFFTIINFGEMSIISYIYIYSVIVNRICHKPVVCFCFIFLFYHTSQPSV